MSHYNFGCKVPPQRRWPVAWYNPAVLLRSARDLLSTADQIRNFDRRELFSGAMAPVIVSARDAHSDFWWDFVSDTGDGGNATYTVARAAQSPSLSPGEQAAQDPALPKILPRGHLLVLGGDLAYPGASGEEYQYRFIELWEAARPDLFEPKKTVLAIPQNHDWFDNISTFHRHFVADLDDRFLGAHAPQARSYFAAQLPYGWWLFGLDFALVADLDREQYEAFCHIVNQQLQPGDNVILLYPEPYWTRPLGDAARPGYPKRYQRLEALLLARGIKIRLRLAGDLHHYVREQGQDGVGGLDYSDALITCGSAGAFLHPTHGRASSLPKAMDCAHDSGAMTPDLAERVRLGTLASACQTEGLRCYSKAASYPDTDTSRGLSWGNLLAMFQPAASVAWRNWFKVGWAEHFQRFAQGNVQFSVLLGFLYWLAVYCASFVFTESFIPDHFVPASQIAGLPWGDFLGMWLRALLFSPLALGVHLVLLGLCAAIAREDGLHTALSGALLAILHMLAAASLYWLLCQWLSDRYLIGILLVVAGSLVGGLLFGAYFALMARCGLLANNAFSPLAHQGYKGFLRFRIDPAGNLHGYMLGTDHVPQRWDEQPQGGLTRPLWVEAEGEQAPNWQIRDHFTLPR